MSRRSAAAASPSPPTSLSPRMHAAWSRRRSTALGKVDVLVNNAGLGTAYPATRETPEEFRRVIDVNLNGSYWMAQACGGATAPGSSIVNIGSVLGFTTAGLPQAAYASCKAAIIGLTRDLAAQWTGPQGHPRQRARPRVLPDRDDRAVPRGLPRRPAGGSRRAVRARPRS